MGSNQAQLAHHSQLCNFRSGPNHITVLPQFIQLLPHFFYRLPPAEVGCVTPVPEWQTTVGLLQLVSSLTSVDLL
ncbi:uncharacterized protein UDID_18112 [Ustilago sp. UG-2017a]|nr:uncharacterized protein UDID_18112 [Ustilago sp. UG-2017a]